MFSLANKVFTHNYGNEIKILRLQYAALNIDFFNTTQTILCAGRPMTQDTGKEDLTSTFKWFCQEKMAALPIHRTIMKPNANNFMVQELLRF